MTNTVNNVLLVQNISKRYVGIQALDNVSIDFKKGETHALVGENGAGKSTLIKIISGAEVPDSGNLVFEDKSFDKMTPHLAQSVGVATIYQEFNLFPTLSVAENIFMGDETLSNRKRYFYNKKEYIDKAKKVLDSMKININPLELIENLTTAKMRCWISLC
jgi:ribose transport system ATP-binding protein